MRPATQVLGFPANTDHQNIYNLNFEDKKNGAREEMLETVLAMEMVGQAGEIYS